MAISVSVTGQKKAVSRGHFYRHSKGMADFHLGATSGLQRAVRLLDQAQMGRVGQPVEGLHTPMELSLPRVAMPSTSTAHRPDHSDPRRGVRCAGK